MERDESKIHFNVAALIIKVASQCNLNCSYCYLYNHEDTTYLNKPRYMSLKIFKDTMIRALNYLNTSQNVKKISIILHGGEPTLSGAKRLDSYCTAAHEIIGDRLQSISIQTNATLLNESLIEVFKKHNFQIGVSIDGPSEFLNRERVFHNGRSSLSETLQGIRMLQLHGLSPKLLCVVQPGSSGKDVYNAFRCLNINHFDFLLPDVSHDNKEQIYGKFGETPVSDFLIEAFDAWVQENNPKIRIRFFRSIIKLILGGDSESDAFGNLPMSYLMVETNGDIEPLDALKVCENKITSTGLNVSRNEFSQVVVENSLLKRAMFGEIPKPKDCEGCKYIDRCGGGYLPHRYSKARGFDNKSVWCNDIKKIFNHIEVYALEYS